MIGGVSGALALMMFIAAGRKAGLAYTDAGQVFTCLVALVVIIIVDRRNIAKGVVAAFLGLMIATIGVDVLQPISRFTFGTESWLKGSISCQS